MKLQLPLVKNMTITLISTYASNVTNPEETKEPRTKELDALLSAVFQSEKLIVLVEFSACVGHDHHSWDRVIGRHGIQKCNSNSLLFLRTFASHDLSITNTMFRLLTRNKMSWMHP